MNTPLCNIDFHSPEVPDFNKYIQRNRKSVLILGNGFDLCAGLESKYSTFANSNYWPLNKKYPPNSLPYRLNAKKNLNTWFDLEQELFFYAHDYQSRVDTSNIEIDRKAFEDIHKAFYNYLINEVDKFEPKSNLPNLIVKFFQLLPGKDKCIFTFNYTSPESIIRKMGGELKVPVKYVHGSLEENNIILGVGDHNELHKQYHFLYKAMSKHYKSTNIVSELDAADDVFIFGHSMGINDYDYFNNFFLEACNSRKGFRPKLRITIFTRSDEDQIMIKSRIRELSDKKLQRLINMCEFNIISTDNKSALCQFIKNYYQRAYKEYQKNG